MIEWRHCRPDGLSVRGPICRRSVQSARGLQVGVSHGWLPACLFSRSCVGQAPPLWDAAEPRNATGVSAPYERPHHAVFRKVRTLPWSDHDGHLATQSCDSCKVVLLQLWRARVSPRWEGTVQSNALNPARIPELRCRAAPRVCLMEAPGTGFWAADGRGCSRAGDTSLSALLMRTRSLRFWAVLVPHWLTSHTPRGLRSRRKVGISVRFVNKKNWYGSVFRSIFSIGLSLNGRYMLVWCLC